MRLGSKRVRFALLMTILWGLSLGSGTVRAGQAPDLNSLDTAEQRSVEITVDGLISKEIGTSYPGLADLLARDPSEQQGREIQKRILTTSERLLKASRTGSPEHRAELLLAADRLADHLLMEGRTPVSDSRERLRLVAYGLEFRYLELGGGWFYMHNLLWRVWEDYSKTDWGEWAFVLLLENGWDTSGACRNGSDQVHPVIRQGEEFLAGRPDSPRRIEVMFLVAQAYESWWSISLLPKCKSGKEAGCDEEGAEEVNPSEFRDRGAMAREKAIVLYRRVLRFGPESSEGQDARDRLPLLESGKDTHQRRFYCVYD